MTDLEKKYNEICAKAFANVYIKAKDQDSITISPCNYKDFAHLFILYSAKGVGGVLSKPVYVDMSRFQLWRINRKLDKDCRFLRAKQIDKDAINPDEILSFMHDYAMELCGPDFDFGDIYKKFYTQKG